jgi:hypothetical protein
VGVLSVGLLAHHPAVGLKGLAGVAVALVVEGLDDPVAGDAALGRDLADGLLGTAADDLALLVRVLAEDREAGELMLCGKARSSAAGTLCRPPGAFPTGDTLPTGLANTPIRRFGLGLGGAERRISGWGTTARLRV